MIGEDFSYKIRTVREEQRKTLAANLKKHREAAMMSQLQLARRVGCHQNQIVLWESGKAVPLEKWMARLASELGVTSAQLYCKPLKETK